MLSINWIRFVVVTRAFEKINTIIDKSIYQKTLDNFHVNDINLFFFIKIIPFCYSMTLFKRLTPRSFGDTKVINFLFLRSSHVFCTLQAESLIYNIYHKYRVLKIKIVISKEKKYADLQGSFIGPSKASGASEIYLRRQSSSFSILSNAFLRRRIYITIACVYICFVSTL